jgi:hypothetical protein
MWLASYWFVQLLLRSTVLPNAREMGCFWELDSDHLSLFLG